MENFINQISQTLSSDDRISVLPINMIHAIMYLLPYKDAARTSTLSKKWKEFWSKFPIIKFEEYRYFYPYHDHENSQNRCRDRFLEALELAVTRRQMENLDCLKISTNFPGNEIVYNLVNLFITLTVGHGLKKLSLEFMKNESHSLHYSSEDDEVVCVSCYNLPTAVFIQGAAFLSSLSIIGCKIEPFEVINLQLLKSISLMNVHISEELLETVIRKCPLIDFLSLRECHGISFFRIVHKRVTRLTLESCGRLEGFIIDVSTLKFLTLRGHRNFEFDTLTSVLSFCESLHNLTLAFMDMTGLSFLQTLSKYPNLKFLNVQRCTISGRLRITHKNLNKLLIEDCFFDEQLEIKDACNLQYLSCLQYFYLSGSPFWVSPSYYLQHLSLEDDIVVTVHSLESTVNNCHQLLSLTLRGIILDRISLENDSLQTLVIEDCRHLKKLFIVAHNLKFFKYTGRLLSTCAVVPAYNCLNAVELNLRDKNRHAHNHSEAKQQKLCLFLRSLGNFSNNMTVAFDCNKCFMMPETRRLLPPIKYIDCLKVVTKLSAGSSPDLVNLICGLLRITGCQNTLIIVLKGNIIMEMKFEGQNCCRARRETVLHNCIVEHLVEVKIQRFRGSQEERLLVEFLLNTGIHMQIISFVAKRRKKIIELTDQDEVISWIDNLAYRFPNTEFCRL